jgi:hypothetical protein
MEDNGFTVEVKDVSNLADIKTQYHVPAQLQSCHTAIVDGYIIEGHVSVAEIERLLAERPAVAGIAVPGMPPGSPGMAVEGVAAAPYDVFTYDESGATTIYASYGQ